ncbi:glycine-rich domain-containing protein [[Kitasatospora] papulosa]|uniref:glycine-rich domain-containing protein n=1 Tax=[Kitasatospora] papulosa TaxID=1464011 RepID=UPI003801DBCD
MTAVIETPDRVTTNPLGPARSPHGYIGDTQWAKLVGLLMRDHPFDSVMAERVLGQAVAYLITAMENKNRGLGMGPGKIVDIGVHMVMLDTKAYFALCDRFNGGTYLHHVPKIDMKDDGSVARTAEILAAAGWDVDQPLWAADSSACTPCRPGEDGH